MDTVGVSMFSLIFSSLVLLQAPEIPDQQARVGELLMVKPKATKPVKWFLVAGGLTQVPPNLLNDQGNLVLVPTQAGKYKVLAYTQTGDTWEPILFTITVADGVKPTPPPEPGPGPGPAPNPDDFTKDELFQACKSILGGLQEPGMKGNLEKLSQVYGKGAALASKAANLGGWNLAMRQASQEAGIPGTSLLTLRQRLNEELEASLGTDLNAAFPGGLGAKAASLSNRISGILQALAKG